MKRIDETKVRIDSTTVPTPFVRYLLRIVLISVICCCDIINYFFLSRLWESVFIWCTGRDVDPKIAVSKRSLWFERRIATESLIEYTQSAPELRPATNEATTDIVCVLFFLLSFFNKKLYCLSSKTLLQKKKILFFPSTIDKIHRKHENKNSNIRKFLTLTPKKKIQQKWTYQTHHLDPNVLSMTSISMNEHHLHLNNRHFRSYQHHVRREEESNPFISILRKTKRKTPRVKY